MYIFLYVLVIHSVSSENSNLVDSVQNYVKSENYQIFNKIWQPQRKMYEDAIKLILKNGFGKDDHLSLFNTRPLQDILLSEGLFVNDNVVTVLFSKMYLRQMPILINPIVSLDLAAADLNISSYLNKMIITASYEVFMDGKETKADQDPYSTSPFAFPQVKRKGEVTLVADDCEVSGSAITQLHGLFVVLGQDTFRVSNCSFSVEITSRDSGAPPVMAPYLSTRHAKDVQKLLTRPVRAELRVALQAAMYSYINTSAILGANMTNQLEFSQRDLMDETRKEFSEVAIMANKRAARDRIAKEMKPLTVVWTNGEPGRMKLRVANVSVYGLDSLYSARGGGVHRLQASDAIRFATLFVRGTVTVHSGSGRPRGSAFVAELKDVEFGVEFDLGDLTSYDLDAAGWRSIEVSLDTTDDFPSKAVVVGYIQSKLDAALEDHIRSVY